MEFLLILLVIVLAVAIINAKKTGARESSSPKPSYQYRRKSFLMTKAEHSFFNTLNQAYGDTHFIFPQVHLSEFLDHTVKGQDWRGALSTIQRKSVDYIMCDKTYVRPLVAIELDDSTHQQLDRVKRDQLVEAICAQANMPLVRFSSANATTVTVRNTITPFLN